MVETASNFGSVSGEREPRQKMGAIDICPDLNGRFLNFSRQGYKKGHNFQSKSLKGYKTRKS